MTDAIPALTTDTPDTVPSAPSPKKRWTKGKRVTCPICMKPAVAYYAKRKSGSVKITYEHRDEPPVREFIYRGRQYFRHRRCNGGTVKADAQLPEREEAQAAAAAAAEAPTDIDYKKMYLDLSQELYNIVYDLDGETAIRMVKNIRRMISSD
jgi:hypothetical protein